MSVISLPSYLSAFTIISGILVFLAIIAVLNFVIKPLFYIHFYKKQGIRTTFLPGLGFLSLVRKAEREHDDNLYFVKQNAKQNPDLECEVYNLGPYAILLIYSPKLLKPFLTNIEPYVKFKNLQPTTLYQKWGFGSLNGRIFRKHRGCVAGVFAYDILGERVPTMQQNARLACEKIIKSGQLNNVELIHYSLDYSGDNVGDLFFGGHINNYMVDGKPIMTFAAHVQAESGILTRSPLLNIFGPKILKLNLLPEHRKFNEKVRKLRSSVADLIEQRKQKGGKGKDLLSVLLETQKSEDPDVAYTDEMIFDEYVTLFAAGAENPAHTVVLALYLLKDHPDFKQKLLQEIAEIYDKEPATTQTIHKMNYLNSLIYETLRVHSPSFSTQPRISVTDFQLENVKIKKGTLMMPVFFHQNYNDKIFEDSFKFKPERWLDGTLQTDAFKFLPFSAGPRNCLGQHFAMLEVKVMLCEFLKKFDFEVSPGFKLIKTQRFLHVPRDPIRFDLKVKV